VRKLIGVLLVVGSGAPDVLDGRAPGGLRGSRGGRQERGLLPLALRRRGLALDEAHDPGTEEYDDDQPDPDPSCERSPSSAAPDGLAVLAGLLPSLTANLLVRR